MTPESLPDTKIKKKKNNHHYVVELREQSSSMLLNQTKREGLGRKLEIPSKNSKCFIGMSKDPTVIKLIDKPY